ncbi:MAG: GMC family oxidoreductase N-terminal domain-containing protein [Rubrivivax sp.]
MTAQAAAQGVYDYIVVGAGTSGSILAARLTESGKYRVLCLEAGEKGSGYIWAIPPAGNVFMIDNPKVNWRYRSERHESHGNREIYVPRGKMLGGSSSINGMVCNRSQRSVYDAWAAMGCKGWSYDEVLPILKKLESTRIGDDRYRGRSGPMTITKTSKDVAPLFCELFFKAANAIGIPENPDTNGERQAGVAMAQNVIDRGRRLSPATQYLEPARRRPNLTLLAGAEAMSLILREGRCEGVRFRRNGRIEEARATREVVVAGGTANSPKLLELSGIGNPELLRKAGVEPVVALDGVGEGLRDHYAAIMKWRFNRPGISIAKRGRGWGLIVEVLRYVLFRQGFIAQGLGTVRAYIKSTPDVDDADIMLAAAPFIIEMKTGEGRRMSATEGFFMYVHFARTQSTGSIHVRSADPFAAPTINYRFLQNDIDRQGAIDAIRWARRLAEAEPMAGCIAEELDPGPKVRSDEEILDYMRRAGNIAHHMVGTCRMGTDPMAVVDERLRVRGVRGLRVADASVMPTQTSGGSAVPTMMIGEKAAEMILADA